MSFYGLLPTGQHLLVILDNYSRYTEVEIKTSTSTKSIIPKLDSIVARHGIPGKMKSDNGPPFAREEFSRYMNLLGIQNSRSTPLWPQHSSLVDSFMKPLGKAIRSAHAENRPWTQELARFLLNYQATPHTTTGVLLADLLFNRKIRGKLPILNTNRHAIDRHREARENDKQQEASGKKYADQKRHAKENCLRIGDQVISKQQKTNKCPQISLLKYIQ